MKTAYVNFSMAQMKRDGKWGYPELMAHVSDLKTLGFENVEASTPEELQKVIDERGAKAVAFAATYMPQSVQDSAVCVEKKLYTRWFNWKPRVTGGL
jgi:hypothetical protein